MHIAFLTPEYPHRKTSHSGGMGTSIKNLVTRLIQKEHEVSVIVYGQERDEVFNELGIHYHLVSQKNYKIGGFYFYRKHIEKYINKHLKDVDLLEAPDWTGITAFMNLKTPLVIRFHGSDTYFCHIEKRAQKKKNKFFEFNAISKAQAFIAPTNYAGVTSIKLFNQSMELLKVIPYGLDLSQFVNNDISIYEPFTILNVGTIIRKKGVFQLVQVFEKVLEQFPQARLTFIGGDSNDVKTGATSTWKLIQGQTQAHVLEKINYLGKVPYAHVQNSIKNAHVCVFPSLAETLGMVTIESMAMGKAVVNTNIGWAKDLIKDGEDGYMHHPDDIDSYVSIICKLLGDKNEVTRIGRNAIKSVTAKFNIDDLVDENVKFYQSILES
ncbi:glycosyltransferase family 4 protein [Nonlabens ulvanivorans]|uniref:glycosyltransferase family 4 protein n=1 Tax=Nonlabens ulvanivorans TaxID=906888 RepID=UPI00294224D6|nr:glycosyltransferase family 4 protein [Nonlabens ulvanivorans]WOI23112.1 glycosyltransferase family 4 protein [Nonlabens ulvanivorans]